MWAGSYALSRGCPVQAETLSAGLGRLHSESVRAGVLAPGTPGWQGRAPGRASPPGAAACWGRPLPHFGVPAIHCVSDGQQVGQREKGQTFGYNSCALPGVLGVSCLISFLSSWHLKAKGSCRLHFTAGRWWGRSSGRPGQASAPQCECQAPQCECQPPQPSPGALPLPWPLASACCGDSLRTGGQEPDERVVDQKGNGAIDLEGGTSPHGVPE